MRIILSRIRIAGPIAGVYNSPTDGRCVLAWEAYNEIVVEANGTAPMAGLDGD
jgi:hypothetical protein